MCNVNNNYPYLLIFQSFIMDKLMSVSFQLYIMLTGDSNVNRHNCDQSDNTSSPF